MSEENTQLAISVLRYDGPFDLLLALIRRQEYPIDDLPVLEITSQFLAYVRSAEDLDSELGGEFVEVASWLVLLKSRSLLPREKDEGPTPQEELRRAVLDHQTLLATSEFLRERSGKSRPGSAGAPGAREDLVLELSGEDNPTVQDVLEAARRALESARAARSLENTETGNATVEDLARWIGARLASVPLSTAVSTGDWFRELGAGQARAALLLALLELARKGILLLYQGEDYAPIRVKSLEAVPPDLPLDAYSYGDAPAAG